MKIKRSPLRRNAPLIGIGCVFAIVGCIAVAGIAVLLLWPRLQGAALQAAGFVPQGNTDVVFTDVTATPIIVGNPVEPPEAVIHLGDQGSQPLSNDSSAYTVVTGSSETGAPVATVSFTEAGLMDLCRQRSPICTGADNRFQNAHIDLRPGGTVIYADVQIPDTSIQQTVGVVLRLDSSGRQFEVAGVDIGGALYDTPPGEFSGMMAEAERTGNDILNQLVLEAGGDYYTLSQVVIDEQTLTLVLQ